MAASLPHGQLALLPGDHFIANKQSAAFNAAVESFLCGGAECAPPEQL